MKAKKVYESIEDVLKPVEGGEYYYDVEKIVKDIINSPNPNSVFKIWTFRGFTSFQKRYIKWAMENGKTPKEAAHKLLDNMLDGNNEFVFEGTGIGDILKPKSEEELEDAKKQAKNKMAMDKNVMREWYQASNAWDYLMGKPNIGMPPFHFEIEDYWNPETKEYEKIKDVTQEAGQMIADAARKINPDTSKVKVLERSRMGNVLINFIRDKMQSVFQTGETTGDKIFHYTYSGDDMAYFGRNDGFNLFLVSEDFLPNVEWE